MLRFLEVVCVAAVIGGLFMVSPWLLLVAGGLVGLGLVDRVERS